MERPNHGTLQQQRGRHESGEVRGDRREGDRREGDRREGSGLKVPCSTANKQVLIEHLTKQVEALQEKDVNSSAMVNVLRDKAQLCETVSYLITRVYLYSIITV